MRYSIWQLKSLHQMHRISCSTHLIAMRSQVYKHRRILDVRTGIWCFVGSRNCIVLVRLAFSSADRKVSLAKRLSSVDGKVLTMSAGLGSQLHIKCNMYSEPGTKTGFRFVYGKENFWEVFSIHTWILRTPGSADDLDTLCIHVLRMNWWTADINE